MGFAKLTVPSRWIAEKAPENPRTRILLLTLILGITVTATTGVTLAVLYQTAIAEETKRLEEAAQSQARLIEAVARFDAINSPNYPMGASAATIDQIRDAHAHYTGFGETGEFTLSRQVGDQIEFLLSHRHNTVVEQQPVAWSSDLAAPARLALKGQSGTMVGKDYRGVQVLAAYEPVAVLNLGIVAKIDMYEVRRPFMMAALLTSVVAAVLILLGVALFRQITEPILTRLEREVHTLRGFLPICSYCKKIRDDEGYWTQLEAYITAHSEAGFSHGICPSCIKTQYPEIHATLQQEGRL